MELGFGKEIEEILDLLGSRLIESVGKGNEVSSISKTQRQNLLLSATLNEKVNHLAKISLQNPIMIGLDDKKMQPDPLLEHAESVESDTDDELEHPRKITNSSTGDYKLPVQLVQKYVKGICWNRVVLWTTIAVYLMWEYLVQCLHSALWFTACSTSFHSKASFRETIFPKG